MYLRKIRYGKKHHCILCAVETNGGCGFAKYDVFLDQHSVPVIKQSHITVRFRAGIRGMNTLIRTKKPFYNSHLILEVYAEGSE